MTNNCVHYWGIQTKQPISVAACRKCEAKMLVVNTKPNTTPGCQYKQDVAYAKQINTILQERPHLTEAILELI